MPLTFLYFIFSKLPISVWSDIRFYLKSLSEKQAAVVHDPHIENWQPRITLHVGNQQHYIAVDQVWITNTFGVWRICLKSWSINFFWSGLTLTKYCVDIVYLVYTQFGKLICTTRYNHITTPSSLPQLLPGGISTRQNCYLLIAWKTVGNLFDTVFCTPPTQCLYFYTAIDRYYPARGFPGSLTQRLIYWYLPSF